MEQNPPPPTFPSPDELKAKITEFMKQNFGDRVSVATFPQPELAEAPSEEKPEKSNSEEFEFDFLPRDIKAHLDRFVIKQEEAKKVLSIAVCDHYNHVNFQRQLEKQDAVRAEETEYAKQNVILVGPTGVGKTYLIKHIADLIKVPFVKADATKFSETGYVGGDVEDLVRAFEAVRSRMEKTSGEVYNIGGGIENSTSILETIELIEKVTGKKLHYEMERARAGDQLFYVTDFEKLRRDTAWQPRVNVRQTLENMYHWWKRNRELFPAAVVSGRPVVASRLQGIPEVAS